MLELREVVKHYRVGGDAIRAVDGVSLSVTPGEVVGLCGPSGSGKTTLINLIAGLQPPDSGTICVNGDSVVGLSPSRASNYRLNKLGIVMQPHTLQPGARAIASASLKLMTEGKRSARRRIEPLLAELGLANRLQHRTEQLSMGERQRVLIALALSRDPALVLADEPTAHLDSEATEHVLKLLRGMCVQRNMALLLVSHNLEATRRYADRIEFIRDGRLTQPPPNGR